MEMQNKADAKLGSYRKKTDLNHANARDFQQYPGMYPTLARKIVANAPYKSVEDVLNIPGLSEQLKKVLQENLDEFTVTNIDITFTEGDSPTR